MSARVPISDLKPAGRGAPPGFALFALGFRPFFLLAGLYSVLLMALWLHSFVGGRAIDSYYGVYGWHAHGMLFGYTIAVIAGFLLTAVRNWTGRQTLAGLPLAALAGLWLVARLLPFFPESVPDPLTAAVDLAFLPVLAVVVAVPLWRGGQRHNLVFVPLLLALAAGNLLVHLQRLGYSTVTEVRGNALAIDLVVLLIAILGGRVIPFFTEGAVGITVRRWPWVERIGIGALLVLALSDLLYPVPVLIAVVAAVGAAAHLIRLAGWHGRAVWSQPLLWVLHAGYLWVGVGLGLQAAAAAQWIPSVLAWHAFTAGAIGTLTLGMMSRVALGHTGRTLEPAGAMALAFGLVVLAAFIRVVAPIALPQSYLLWITLSGGLWVLAFGTFVVVYAPMLLRPRVDGRPG